MNNPFSLEGKKILVTGASSGIGRSTAIACAQMGADVILTGRNLERLNETMGCMTPGNHFHVVADLTNEEDRQNLIESTPSLDGLVHCAGISGHQVFSYLKTETLHNMFEVNYFSPVFLTRELLRRNKINRFASIVFMTSTSGILSSYVGGAAYSSTKGAVSGLIKGMALDLAPKRIRVNSIMAAMIETPIMQGGDVTQEQFNEDMKKYPLKRYGKPEEVAYGIVYLLSDVSSWITGTNLLMDGGRTISY